MSHAGRTSPSNIFIPRQESPLTTKEPPAPWHWLFWAALAFAILRSGAVEKPDWYLCLAAIGVTTLLYHARTPRSQSTPDPGRCLRFTLVGLPAYALWQILPIPASLLAHFSPHRAEIVAALNQIGNRQAFVSLSLLPSETLFQLTRICGCALLFLASRNLAWRWPERAWRLAFPLIGIAAVQAILGLVQAFAAPDGFAQGTYVNRNHFAGFLEMALPFALAYPFAVMRTRRFESERIAPALKACLAMTAATLIFAAITYSLSRSGFTAALASIAIMAIAAGARKLRRRAQIAVGIAVAVSFIGFFVLLPPDRLIERFGQLSRPVGFSSDTRAKVWRETTQLIADYPVFGVGLGAFEAALYPYRTTAVDVRMDYAHNDYLQVLAETGIAGFSIIAVLVAALAAEAVRALRRSGQTPLALAAIGALAALSAHSITDFNLYIPANALVAAWVAGIASGLSAVKSEYHRRRKTCISHSNWPLLPSHAR